MQPRLAGRPTRRLAQGRPRARRGSPAGRAPGRSAGRRDSSARQRRRPPRRAAIRASPASSSTWPPPSSQHREPAPLRAALPDAVASEARAGRSTCRSDPDVSAARHLPRRYTGPPQDEGLRPLPPGRLRRRRTTLRRVVRAGAPVRSARPSSSRRFANLRCSIVTPDGAVRWDGERLEFIDSPPRDTLPRRTPRGPLAHYYGASSMPPASISRRCSGDAQPILAEPAGSERIPWPDPRESAHRVSRLRRRGGACARAALTRRTAAQAQQPPAGRAQVDALDACRRCPLWEHATAAVGGGGPVDANWCSSVNSRATRKICGVVRS